ncbi:hypothetical protein BAGA_07395 [Bacillus gaemokensis]|uniref:Uncharacterized protein n=1 Tax=Bacillus gaemokensis TaxID=574375 RepID=A0A073KAK6_9BACI|nr:hypothetical protein BAGA_07395 [Bacillus gaemokensis]KYG26340.1 hypothetical protein AZF08_16230 [Bacillus gaemokensis]
MWYVTFNLVSLSFDATKVHDPDPANAILSISGCNGTLSLYVSNDIETEKSKAQKYGYLNKWGEDER